MDEGRRSLSNWEGLSVTGRVSARNFQKVHPRPSGDHLSQRAGIVFTLPDMRDRPATKLAPTPVGPHVHLCWVFVAHETAARQQLLRHTLSV